MSNLCIQCDAPSLVQDEKPSAVEPETLVCDDCLCERLQGEALLDYDCGLVAHTAFIADLERTENIREALAFPRL